MKTRDSLARAAVVAAIALFIFSQPGFAKRQDQPEPQILQSLASQNRCFRLRPR